ncbi:MAG: hypothetical protein AAF550_14840 [Myxococcota bacterium]
MGYSLGAAAQLDLADNELDYLAYSYLVELTAAVPGAGGFVVGYEGSPSDDGNASFAYPLSTGQRLHRISDRFLTTPVEGLNELFLAWEIVGVLPFVDGFLGYRHDRTDQGFDSRGHEVDLVLSFPVLTHLTIDFTGGYFFIGERDEDPDTIIAAIDFVINI